MKVMSKLLRNADDRTVKEGRHLAVAKWMKKRALEN